MRRQNVYETAGVEQQVAKGMANRVDIGAAAVTRSLLS